MLERKETCETLIVDDDGNFREFLANRPTGLRMVPEKYGETNQLVLKSEAGQFAKWIRAHDPKIAVEVSQQTPRLLQRSCDVWLPLIFLANDLSLPVFLNLVANYLWDRMKGALKGDAMSVHLSVEYENKADGTVKRFNFEGDADALQKVIKKFDPNQFLDE